jgi:predicted enzyme related to lactoylglutathione lyase
MLSACTVWTAGGAEGWRAGLKPGAYIGSIHLLNVQPSKGHAAKDAGGTMAKVTGLGGAFLRAADPKALYAWYQEHLGISSPEGSFSFPRETQRAYIAVAFFPKSSEYFPVSQPAMLNFQVDDLDGVLDKLEAAGVAVDPKREDYDYGRFGWFTDPEGNRVELWQPPE